jgi:hypothetical protein
MHLLFIGEVSWATRLSRTRRPQGGNRPLPRRRLAGASKQPLMILRTHTSLESSDHALMFEPLDAAFKAPKVARNVRFVVTTARDPIIAAATNILDDLRRIRAKPQRL